MSDFGGLAFGAQALQAGGGIANGITQSNAIRGQSAFEQSAAEQNAKLLDRAAKDARERGMMDVRNIGLRADQIQGTQRARLAAQGVDVNSGSALDAQMDTVSMSEMDKLTARNNAAREAYGLQSQAQSIRGGAAMGAIGARGAARSTLLQSYTSGAKDLMLGAYYADQMKGLKKISESDVFSKAKGGGSGAMNGVLAGLPGYSP